MNFAPYAPPPDEHRQGTSKNPRKTQGSSPSNPPQPWTSKPSSDGLEPNFWNSYQKGGSAVDPTHASSYSSSKNAAAFSSASSSQASAEREPGTSTYLRPGGRGDGSGPFYPSPEAYETRFGWRVDILSALSYFTPPMAMLILMVETRNDYVRIHAYQSLLLALPLGFLHLLFLWSQFFQVFLFLGDLGLYGWLGYHAYFDAEMLLRKLLPILGPLAERWTEEE